MSDESNKCHYLLLETSILKQKSKYMDGYSLTTSRETSDNITDRLCRQTKLVLNYIWKRKCTGYT